MAIRSDFTRAKGQDFTLSVPLVTGQAGNYEPITDTITSWTWILEIRQTWGATTTVYSSTAGTNDNTAKTVTFSIAKADTQDLASRRYEYQVRQTNSGAETLWAFGDFVLGPPPPSGKTG